MLSTVLGSPHSLSASWVIPDPTNGIISGYTIYCATLSGQILEPFNIGPEDTTAVLDGLTAYTEYDCSISAITGAGEGNLSDPHMATTAEDGMHHCVDYTPYLFTTPQL